MLGLIAVSAMADVCTTNDYSGDGSVHATILLELQNNLSHNCDWRLTEFPHPMAISSAKSRHIVHLNAAGVQQQQIVNSQQPHTTHS